MAEAEDSSYRRSTRLPSTSSSSAPASRNQSLPPPSPPPLGNPSSTSTLIPSTALIPLPSRLPSSPPSSAQSRRPVYSEGEIVPEECLEDSRKFNLDVPEPRFLFCADKAVEFKATDELFVCEEGRLEGVPDTRAKIFKDKRLSLLEKNLLMTFLISIGSILSVSRGLAMMICSGHLLSF